MKRKLLILLTLILATLFTVTFASGCGNSTYDEYTVTFNTDGGSEVASQIVAKGGYAVKPEDPEKAGYTFKGWKTSIIDDWKFDKLSINGDTTLTAKWSIINYTITYELNGAVNASTNPEMYTVESEKIELATPTKDGYKFLGWYDGETVVTEIAKGSTGNKTFTAKWTNKFKINFDTSDGSTVSPAQMEVVYGQPIPTLPVPTKGTEIFTRWVDSLGNTLYSGGVWTQFNDLTVYPEWENIADILLTLDTKGGELADDVKVYVQNGKKVGKLPVPVLEKYKFKGWTLDGNPIDENTIWQSEESATLVATYVRVFKVQFTTTAIVRKAYATGKLINSGSITLGSGQELESRILEIEEGQTLRDIGIDVLPTVEPIDKDEYTGKSNWRYYESNEDRYPEEITLDTVFNDTNLSGTPTVVIIRPYFRANWTPTY